MLPPLTFDEDVLNELEDAFKVHLKNAENERLQRLNDSISTTLPPLVKCSSTTDSDKLVFRKTKKNIEKNTLPKKEAFNKNSNPKKVTPIHSSPEIKESTNQITKIKKKFLDIEIKEAKKYFLKAPNNNEVPHTQPYKTRDANHDSESNDKEFIPYRPGRKPSKSLLINISGSRTPGKDKDSIPVELLELTSKRNPAFLTKESSLLRLPNIILADIKHTKDNEVKFNKQKRLDHVLITEEEKGVQTSIKFPNPRKLKKMNSKSLDGDDTPSSSATINTYSSNKSPTLIKASPLRFDSIIKNDSYFTDKLLRLKKSSKLTKYYQFSFQSDKTSISANSTPQNNSRRVLNFLS